jgi:hypothetical protein
MLKLDHFTPLSRAVASIDRDAYAARFAVYDREHKKLLRRLATAESPVSDADIVREEQAFRDAIRRIEFADEGEQATLVPQDELAEAPPPEPPPPEPPPLEPARAEPPRSQPVWPQVRARRESLEVANSPDSEPLEPDIAVEPAIHLSQPRSVARRVGERLTLAVVALALTGAGLWMTEARRDRTPDSARAAAPPSEPATPDNTADAKAQQPTWLSPQMFYAPPPVPSSMPSSAPQSSAPRADVPLPTPRPDR